MVKKATSQHCQNAIRNSNGNSNVLWKQMQELHVTEKNCQKSVKAIGIDETRPKPKYSHLAHLSR